jgi:hypothetical protein
MAQILGIATGNLQLTCDGTNRWLKVLEHEIEASNSTIRDHRSMIQPSSSDAQTIERNRALNDIITLAEHRIERNKEQIQHLQDLKESLDAEQEKEAEARNPSLLHDNVATFIILNSEIKAELFEYVARFEALLEVADPEDSRARKQSIDGTAEGVALRERIAWESRKGRSSRFRLEGLVSDLVSQAV